MKISILTFLPFIFGLLYIPVYAQTETEPELLGLPGDNLNLYAVLDLFQKSKTIEEFEKELNLEKTGINNLDLNLDEKVDFIKVETKQKGDDFTFILQVAVSEKETQDVAVILVSKNEKKEVTMQIVGDKDLYGKDYIIEPADKPGSTANPGYTGDDPVTENVQPTTSTVVVQSAPIVQYVYSPAYVPYYPPYYYGYYPPYYFAFSVMAVGMYWGHHSHYYHGGYGYHHTTVIHNTNNFNNYNSNRQISNTVVNNKASGKYNNASTRPSTGASTRPSTGASTRPSTGASTRPSTGASTRPSTGASTRPSTGASTRPSTGASTGASTRPSTGASASSRPVTSPSTGASASTRPSTSSSSMGASRNMSSGGYSGGASRSSTYSGGGASSRAGGGYSGGGASRGGGGGGRRR